MFEHQQSIKGENMQENNFVVNLEQYDVELFVAHKEFLNDVEMQVSTINFEELSI